MQNLPRTRFLPKVLKSQVSSAMIAFMAPRFASILYGVERMLSLANNYLRI